MALVAVLLVGALWRFDSLTARSFGHVEAYVPGIQYPANISDPSTHDTYASTVRWSLDDVHGPFWYLWMLPYVRAFGASLFAIRLPSAVFGLATVWLVYLVGRRARDRWTGVVAATMLALNGHHSYWSRQARSAGFGPALQRIA